jgi:hypothetical protein
VDGGCGSRDGTGPEGGEGGPYLMNSPPPAEGADAAAEWARSMPNTTAARAAVLDLLGLLAGVRDRVDLAPVRPGGLGRSAAEPARRRGRRSVAGQLADAGRVETVDGLDCRALCVPARWPL